MARKFSDEDKAEVSRSERMPFGITPVQITLATFEEPEGKSEYLELSLISADGLEDTVRLYLSEKATRYTVQTIRDIAVHNADDDETKDKRRAAVDGVADGEELAALINQRMTGFQCWYTRYYDPERSYQGSDGKSYRSVNTNVVGYEPKLKEDLMPTKNRDQAQLDPKDYPDDDIISQGKPVKLDVPFTSDSDAPGSKVKETIPEDWA